MGLGYGGLDWADSYTGRDGGGWAEAGRRLGCPDGGLGCTGMDRICVFMVPMRSLPAQQPALLLLLGLKCIVPSCRIYKLPLREGLVPMIR